MNARYGVTHHSNHFALEIYHCTQKLIYKCFSSECRHRPGVTLGPLCGSGAAPGPAPAVDRHSGVLSTTAAVPVVAGPVASVAAAPASSEVPVTQEVQCAPPAPDVAAAPASSEAPVTQEVQCAPPAPTLADTQHPATQLVHSSGAGCPPGAAAGSAPPPPGTSVAMVGEASAKAAASKGHCVFYALFAGISELPGHNFPNYAEMINSIRSAVKSGRASLESVLCGDEKLMGEELVEAHEWIENIQIGGGYGCSAKDPLLIAYCSTFLVPLFLSLGYFLLKF